MIGEYFGIAIIFLCNEFITCSLHSQSKIENNKIVLYLIKVIIDYKLIMMLSYNWQIMDAIDKDEQELKNIITVPQPIVEDLYSSQ